MNHFSKALKEVKAVADDEITNIDILDYVFNGEEWITMKEWDNWFEEEIGLNDRARQVRDDFRRDIKEIYPAYKKLTSLYNEQTRGWGDKATPKLKKLKREVNGQLYNIFFTLKSKLLDNLETQIEKVPQTKTSFINMVQPVYKDGWDSLFQDDYFQVDPVDSLTGEGGNFSSRLWECRYGVANEIQNNQYRYDSTSIGYESLELVRVPINLLLKYNVMSKDDIIKRHNQFSKSPEKIGVEVLDDEDWCKDKLLCVFAKDAVKNSNWDFVDGCILYLYLMNHIQYKIETFYEVKNLHQNIINSFSRYNFPVPEVNQQYGAKYDRPTDQYFFTSETSDIFTENTKRFIERLINLNQSGNYDLDYDFGNLFSNMLQINGIKIKGTILNLPSVYDCFCASTTEHDGNLFPFLDDRWINNPNVKEEVAA